MEGLLKNDKRLFWCNLCYFIILTLFVVLRIVAKLGILDFAGEYSDALFTFLVQIIILFTVPLLMYTLVFKQKPREIFRSFGYRKVSFKIVLQSILMGIVAFFIIMFVSTFFSVFIQMLGYKPFYSYGESTPMSFWSFLLSLLTVAVMPGLFEEFSHRGMLLSGFTKMSSIKAVVLSGLLFGLMHLNINQFFYAFVVGMLLAIVALITKSIWPSVIIHFMNNGINTYLDYASSNGYFGANFGSFILLENVNIFLRFFLYILIICAVVYVGIWLLIKMYTTTKKDQFSKFVKEFTGIKDSNQQIDVENAQELLEIYFTQGKNIDLDLASVKGDKIRVEQAQSQVSMQNEPSIPQVVMKTNSEGEQALPIDMSAGQNANNSAKKMTFTQLLNRLLPKNGENYKPTFKENFFLYCSIFLGSVVTIMTFIWGLF